MKDLLNPSLSKIRIITGKKQLLKNAVTIATSFELVAPKLLGLYSFSDLSMGDTRNRWELIPVARAIATSTNINSIEDCLLCRVRERLGFP
jgi:hypothetical protein